MRRFTWFTVGAATGVYGILKARRAAQTLTPGGVQARAAAVKAGLRVFTSEVAAGRAEREAELRSRAAVGPGGPPGAVPSAIEGTAAPRHRREQAGIDEASTDRSGNGSAATRRGGGNDGHR